MGMRKEGFISSRETEDIETLNNLLVVRDNSFVALTQ